MTAQTPGAELPAAEPPAAGPPAVEPPAAKPMHATATLPAIASLATRVQEASDEAAMRITGLLDSLVARGDVDRVLDAVRPRLRMLGPIRRRTLARALFEPFDPVIATPAAWRAGLGSIPRSIIAPVTALVRLRLATIAEVDTALAAGTEPAPQLWTEAARLLAETSLPQHWHSTAFRAETGIRQGMLEPLCEALRLLFSQAAPLRLAAQGHEIEVRSLRPLLLAATRSGPIGCALVVALLLERTGRPEDMLDTMLAVARESMLVRPLDDALQSVMEGVVGHLHRPPATASSADGALAAQARLASRVVGFSSLRGDMARFGPQLAPRRHELASECCVALELGFDQVRRWALTAPGGAAAEDAMVERIEAHLRALKRLDVASRPLGAAVAQDHIFKQIVAFCADGGRASWLTAVDRMRLCEILVGSEAARLLC
ncbi:hypothetical protein [Lichenicoccus roseus]|uniref:Uncharacterized protein n=1 Tax=Lichenicoccus roseus TaxID=2683649 RepID=A0A5R9J253_9PROT|nr:hypothetical protein [Lichenicoccus roseus]TLU71704.1 hypothetical protein FE263_14630 [Lichenicoccus roseus]